MGRVGEEYYQPLSTKQNRTKWNQNYVKDGGKVNESRHENG